MILAAVKERGWLLFLGAAGITAVLYLAGPPAMHVGGVFNAFGILSAAATLLGVWIHRPSKRTPWFLFAFGQLVFVAGDILAYNYQHLFGRGLPFPSLADPLYLAFYPAFVLGILLLVRQRNPGGDRASLIDSLILAISLGMLSWLFLIGPNVHDDSLDALAKVVSMAYPTMDAVLLAVAVRLAVGRGHRGPAYRLLIGAIAALLLTDAVYAWLLLHGGYQTGALLDGGWILFYLLWGAAALHPSMADLSAPAAPSTRLSRARLGLLASATAIPLAIQLVETQATADGGDRIATSSAAVLIFGLVLWRMSGLVRAQEAAAERERVLRTAGSALVAARTQSEILEAVESAAATLAADGAECRVYRVDGTGGRLLLSALEGAPAGPTPVALAAAGSAVQEALAGGEVRTVADATALLCRARRRAAVAPLLSRGAPAGLLVVGQDEELPPATITALAALSLQASLALDSAAASAELHRAASEERFRTLVQHSSDVVFVLGTATDIRYVSPSAERVLSYAAEELVGRHLLDLLDPVARAPVVAWLDGIAGAPSTEPALLEFRLLDGRGAWLDTETFATNLLADPAIAGIVMNLRDVTDRKLVEDRLAHQAFHDPVTGLANRALFHDRVEHALRRRHDVRRGLGILFLDLDEFKAINDTLGHQVGDEVLREVGRRLTVPLRIGDTAARLGGDEFAILLEEIDGRGEAERVAERVLDAVRTPFVVDGKEITPNGSIGIAVALAEDARTTVEDLLRDADIAMYDAKAGGKGIAAVFEPRMRSDILERVELRDELAAAIAAEELRLVYQPIVGLQSGAVVGMEALLRWSHPVRGEIPPSVFIPVAEETGQIVALGRHVLERACRDAVALGRHHGLAAGLVVSVNLSAPQLQSAELVDDVVAALEASGLPPANLMLEITETMMMRNMELAVERLLAVRRVGVRVALDDFGTGYSSLNHIRQLPIDMLKIDKSFIQSIHDDSAEEKLASTIIELARALDFVSIAEGVEHPAQLAKLNQLGCTCAQGFLLCTPLPLEELAATMAPQHDLWPELLLSV